MRRPDLLSSTWQRWTWFGGGFLTCALIAVPLSSLSSCCATAQPCSPPILIPMTQPAPMSKLAERIDELAHKLECLDCAPKKEEPPR